MFTTTNYLSKNEEIDFALLDYKKIHKQLRETLYRQRKLKREDLPYASYNVDSYEAHQKWYKNQREFESLSGKMTKLCCLLAHSKGKLHMRRARTFFNLQETIDVTMDMQRKIIGHFWKDYVVK